MVTNEFLSWRRRRRVATVPLHEAPEPAVHPREDHDDLRQLPAALPGQQRAVLVLRYYEGLTDS